LTAASKAMRHAISPTSGCFVQDDQVGRPLGNQVEVAVHSEPE